MLQQVSIAAAFLIFVASATAPHEPSAARKGLQELGDFIGQWNLQAESKAGGKTTAWKETITFSWKFKGDDAWIVMDVKDSKHLAPGELRFDPEKNQYTLTLAREGSPLLFTGELKRGRLVLTAEDKTTGSTARMSMNTLSDGVRFNLVYDIQTDGPFANLFKAAGTKEGETFAGGKGARKPECIVTGGAASIAVSYQGKTYYVCCSGCRDEFNENPAKYVEEFEKKQKP